MEYDRIEVTPVAGALGAEVGGIDLGQPLDDETVAELRRALLDHIVLFFRDQRLSIEQHKALGRRFGKLDEHPFIAGMPDHPEVLDVVKEADETLNFGGQWHSDVTFQPAPALGSILYAREVPDYRGDTLFANQYLAYDTLSAGMKAMLEGLRAVHTAAHVFTPDAPRYRVRRSMKLKSSDTAAVADEVLHPVVRRHPETGRKALFVNGSFTVRFEGWSEDESRPLLAYLYGHAIRPEFTCRFRWAKDSVAFWDNRCALHYALNDYPGERRALHRVTIAGDRPA